MKRLISVLVGMAIIRHVNNKQDAEWCHDHGYTNTRPKTASASEQAENSSKSVSSPWRRRRRTLRAYFLGSRQRRAKAQ